MPARLEAARSGKYKSVRQDAGHCRRDAGAPHPSCGRGENSAGRTGTPYRDDTKKRRACARLLECYVCRGTEVRSVTATTEQTQNTKRTKKCG